MPLIMASLAEAEPRVATTRRRVTPRAAARLSRRTTGFRLVFLSLWTYWMKTCPPVAAPPVRAPRGGDGEEAVDERRWCLAPPAVAPDELDRDPDLLGAEDRIDLARLEKLGDALAPDRDEGVAAREAGLRRRAVGEDLRDPQLELARLLEGEAHPDELALREERVAGRLRRDVAEARVERAVAHRLQIGLGRGIAGGIEVGQLAVPVVDVPQGVADEGVLSDRRAGVGGARAGRGGGAPAGEGCRGKKGGERPAGAGPVRPGREKAHDGSLASGQRHPDGRLGGRGEGPDDLGCVSVTRCTVRVGKAKL